MRRLLIGCGSIILAIFVIGLLPFTIFWILINQVDRQDHRDVGWAFAIALKDNDDEKAKSLAAKSQWDRIDSWVDSHQSFHCPFSWDFDKFPTGGGGGKVPSDEDITTSTTYYYKCGSEPYNFSIDEIILERSSEGWIVTDWRAISESFDW